MIVLTALLLSSLGFMIESEGRGLGRKPQLSRNGLNKVPINGLSTKALGALTEKDRASVRMGGRRLSQSDPLQVWREPHVEWDPDLYHDVLAHPHMHVYCTAHESIMCNGGLFRK